MQTSVAISTSGNSPLNVSFTDTSTGSPTSWSWRFGDGTYSTAKNPVHTYSKAGKYTVSLTVRNAAGSNIGNKIQLYKCRNPHESSSPLLFLHLPPQEMHLLKVQFTDTSTGSPTSWKWSFGDGTSSTTKNPVHTYSKTGKYTVTLTVRNAAGSNVVTKSSYINVGTA